MRPIKVTTETDIPTVFHAEVAEVAEVATTVEVDEGVAVGFQEVVSDDVGCAEDSNVGMPSDVDETAAGSVGEDEVWVRDGGDVEMDETISEGDGLNVVGLAFGGNRTLSPRLGKRGLVVVVES